MSCRTESVPSRFRLLVLALLLPALCAAGLRAESIVFPADAGLVDVTKEPYNARGDGTTDCTAAVQKAFDDNLGSNATLYFPDGTYLFSDSVGIFKAVAHSKTRFVHLQGQSEKGTILKLKDTAPGFGDPAAPKVFFSLYNGAKTGDAMHTAARNVTIDVGAGNPGAAGFSFLANNSGCVYDLTVRSSDPQKAGAIGLDLRNAQQGPALIKRVTVEGFDRGIQMGGSFSMVFEHITLLDQRKVGFDNAQGRVTIRGLTVRGAPIAVTNLNRSDLTLVDAKLSGGGKDDAAIVTENTDIFLRDIAVSGYGHTVRTQPRAPEQKKPAKKGGKKPAAPAEDGEEEAEEPAPAAAAGPTTVDGDIAEWYGGKPHQLFTGPEAKTLRLPVQETPVIPWETDLAKWIKAPIEGAEALQKAIDEGVAAGKTTLYFPKLRGKEQKYVIDRPIRIHGSINRIIGMEGILWIAAGPELPVGADVFVFEDLKGPLVFERFFNILVNDGWKGYKKPEEVRYLFANRTKHPLIIQNTPHGACQLKKPQPGTIWFLEDVVGLLEVGKGETVWFRQFNPESPDLPMAVVDGGQLWVLGLKTEGRATHIEARNGATVELIGGVSYQSWKTQPLDPPMFLIKDSKVSLTVGFYHYNLPFTTIVEETFQGQTKSLPRTGMAQYHLPIYRSGVP